MINAQVPHIPQVYWPEVLAEEVRWRFRESGKDGEGELIRHLDRVVHEQPTQSDDLRQQVLDVLVREGAGVPDREAWKRAS